MRIKRLAVAAVAALATLAFTAGALASHSVGSTGQYLATAQPGDSDGGLQK